YRARPPEGPVVVEMWVCGEILGPRVETLDTVEVVLVTKMEIEEVPWLTVPPGGKEWARDARLTRKPVTVHWRSRIAPVWNHRIAEPAMVWSNDDGIEERVLTAIRQGEGERYGEFDQTPDDLMNRLRDELAVSLRAVRKRAHEYRQNPAKPA